MTLSFETWKPTLEEAALGQLQFYSVVLTYTSDSDLYLDGVVVLTHPNRYDLNVLAEECALAAAQLWPGEHWQKHFVEFLVERYGFARLPEQHCRWVEMYQP